MVSTIEFHERHLANWKLTLSQDLERHVREGNRLMRQKEEIKFLEEQIAEAKKRGKDKFDEERFMRKKGV